MKNQDSFWQWGREIWNFVYHCLKPKWKKNTAKKIRFKATLKIYQILSITLKSHAGDIYEDWYNKVV